MLWTVCGSLYIGILSSSFWREGFERFCHWVREVIFGEEKAILSIIVISGVVAFSLGKWF